MRLLSVGIPQFKNLRDFHIAFDPSEATTVLLGRNGSGKSNLLEALVIIFRDLERQQQPAFAYELSFICYGHEVRISADPARATQRVRVHVDGVRTSLRAFSQRRDTLLPANVFAYYSGPSDRLEEHFRFHQRRFYDALLRGDDEPLRPLFYARPEHSQFVLLAFFSTEDPEVSAFLETHLEITGLGSVLFVLRRPDWARNRSATGGDSRFWGAKGTVQGLLDRLYDLALAPSYQTEPVQTTYRQQSTSEETLHLFLRNADALRTLASAYATQADFFKALESLYISDMVREIRIEVHKKNLDAPLTFKELSEGEQQLLTVFGLVKFTATAEALFLLDEPDTHLNPAWSYEYLAMLEDIVGPDESTHLVIATHDPVLIGGLTRNQVRVFQSGSLISTTTAEAPAEDPRGMGVSALLTSDLFGLHSAVDAPTQAMLDRSQELFAEESRTQSEQEELRELTDRLSALGFARSIRDPLYEKFVKAVGALPEFKAQDLTPEEVHERDAIALRAVQEILSDEPAQ
jgi:predicted ATPase